LGKWVRAAVFDSIRTWPLQHDHDEAFAAFAGRATLIDDPSDIARRWENAYDSYFPTETDRLNAAFIEVVVQRMELWIRGITPEPFGLQPTIVERRAGGKWLSVPKASSQEEKRIA
jgi:hypothetical protein